MFTCDVTNEYCMFYRYQTDRNYDLVLELCTHPNNTEPDVEGNANCKNCPLNKDKGEYYG